MQRRSLRTFLIWMTCGCWNCGGSSGPADAYISPCMMKTRSGSFQIRNTGQCGCANRFNWRVPRFQKSITGLRCSRQTVFHTIRSCFTTRCMCTKNGLSSCRCWICSPRPTTMRLPWCSARINTGSRKRYPEKFRSPATLLHPRRKRNRLVRPRWNYCRPG